MKGIVIPTVGWLILAIVGLIILFIFISQLVPAVGSFLGAAIGGLRREFCKSVLNCWRELEIPPWCWVFCSGL